MPEEPAKGVPCSHRATGYDRESDGVYKRVCNEPAFGEIFCTCPCTNGKRCSHTVMHCSAACNSEGALMTPGFGAENASHLALPPSLEADFLPVKGGCLKD